MSNYIYNVDIGKLLVALLEAKKDASHVNIQFDTVNNSIKIEPVIKRPPLDGEIDIKKIIA